ncbi:MAG: bifunctional methylenetetrahydrofolate dehydrogenase/methenyltetrahydrofolate cyclohydrolase FolD [Bacteroidetes bacterium QS_9_68_14]|nr:MAG: bifunctional methylenetetrahydrofolate dehydrogenase/methenyltetrahydrofolate cyclohydrolase FolD [Bacteroidetes bacterium QS_9_68_14]
MPVPAANGDDPKLIDGRALAATVREEVAEAVAGRTGQGHRPPGLRVILANGNAASASYVRGKEKAAAEVGIESQTLRFDPEEVTEDELLSTLARLNDAADVDGILVQLPLPDRIDKQKIIRAVAPDKDVDGFHPENAGRLMTGAAGFVPATPAGIMEMLRRTPEVEIEGARAVVVGRSNLVGRPLANLLLRRDANATVTVCHSRTRELAAITRRADILVSAVGRAGLITGDMVKAGACVIDVGINRVEDDTRERGYRLVGDVNFEAARKRASHITPVPGGVGPMTIAMLLKNTLKAAEQRAS